MADQPSVFEEQEQAPATEADDQSVTPENKPTSSVDIFADRLASIRNEEGKPKYDSVEKALDGLANAQDYIPQLKSQLTTKDEEIQTLKEQLDRLGSVEEVVERLTAAKDQPAVAEQPSGNSGIDEQQLESLLESMLQKKSLKETQETNFKSVNDTLQQTFGDKAAEVVASKAGEFGLTKEELKELAHRNPKLVLSLFREQSGSTPTTNTNSRRSPLGVPEDKPLERPAKSLLSGATSKDQAAYMRQIKENVYRRHNITE